MEEKEPQFWLDDEPNPAKARILQTSQRRAQQRYNAVPRGRQPIDTVATRPISRAAPEIPTVATDNVIHVKLSIPKLPKYLRISTYAKVIKKLFKSSKLRVAMALVVIAAGALVAKNLIVKPASDGISSETQSSTQIAQNAGVNPLLPAGKSSPDQAKILNSTFDKTKQLFTFADTYQGANFTVSEQPLPSSLKNDDKAFKTAAEAIGAKKPLETTKGTVYVGTLPKQTVQLAVLKTKSQLIFIRSSTELEDYFWVKYIDSLKFSS